MASRSSTNNKKPNSKGYSMITDYPVASKQNQIKKNTVKKN